MIRTEKCAIKRVVTTFDPTYRYDISVSLPTSLYTITERVIVMPSFSIPYSGIDTLRFLKKET